MRDFLILIGFVIFSSLAALAMSPVREIPPLKTTLNNSPDNLAWDKFAVDFVKSWEGMKLTAYFDVVNVPTICAGHTRTVTAQMVRDRVTWSTAKCDTLLLTELREYRDGVYAHLKLALSKGLIPLRRSVAWTSFAFNVGVRGAGKSTATRRLNNGDVKGACDALTWWNKAGGRVWRGLVNRRSAEQELCLHGL